MVGSGGGGGGRLYCTYEQYLRPRVNQITILLNSGPHFAWKLYNIQVRTREICAKSEIAFVLQL